VVLLTVRDRVVTDIQSVPLDVLRWARVVVDCNGADSLDAVHMGVRKALDTA
jgi:hypothetical protein